MFSKHYYFKKSMIFSSGTTLAFWVVIFAAASSAHLASPPSGSDRGSRTLHLSLCGRRIRTARRPAARGATVGRASATGGSRSREGDLFCARPGVDRLMI